MRAERPPFERTVCACEEDRSYCKTRPGHLIPSDVARIAAALPGRPVTEYLVAAPGALARETQTGIVRRIPTITPASDRSGRCVFLTSDERCSIHAVAPFGCAYFDAHQGGDEGDRRSLWGLGEIVEDLAYTELRDTLPFSTLRPRKALRP